MSDALVPLYRIDQDESCRSRPFSGQFEQNPAFIWRSWGLIRDGSIGVVPQSSCDELRYIFDTELQEEFSPALAKYPSTPHIQSERNQRIDDMDTYAHTLRASEEGASGWHGTQKWPTKMGIYMSVRSVIHLLLSHPHVKEPVKRRSAPGSD